MNVPQPWIKKVWVCRAHRWSDRCWGGEPADAYGTNHKDCGYRITMSVSEDQWKRAGMPPVGA